MTIKYIVHTTSSYRDLNGNTYHFARITSTKTKKSLVITDVGGTSNAAGLLFNLKLVNDWSEVYDAQTWEKRRDWERMNRRFANDQQVYEYQVTAKMIRALNRKSKAAA